MKFTKDSFINGTSLKGDFYAYYHEIVEIFGEPDFGPNGQSGDGKVKCQWSLQFEDGTYATIYDWKEPETPMGPYSWHIGGKSYEAVDRVLETMGRSIGCTYCC